MNYVMTVFVYFPKIKQMYSYELYTEDKKNRDFGKLFLASFASSANQFYICSTYIIMYVYSVYPAMSKSQNNNYQIV